MKNRKYDWPHLLKEFEASGLSQAAFCKEYDLNPRYFSLKRSKILKEKTPRFEKIEVTEPALSSSTLTLQVGRCQIHCPNTMPVDSLVALVQKLA